MPPALLHVQFFRHVFDRKTQGTGKLRILRPDRDAYCRAHGTGTDMQSKAVSRKADAVVEGRAHVEHQLGQRPHQTRPVDAVTVKGAALLSRICRRCRMFGLLKRRSGRQAQSAVQGVGTAAVVVLRRADITPVACHYLPVKRRAFPEQLREQITPEVEGPLGDALHRSGREYVDARIDQVRHHLRPVRLFDKAADISLPVHHRKTVAQRYFFCREGKRGRRAVFLMGMHQKPEVVIAGGVGGDDEEVLVPIKIPTVFYAARRAEILRLYAVLELHAEFPPIAEMGHDFPGPVVQRRADLCIAVFPQQLDDVLHHRPAQDRHHGFRVLPRHRTQPRPQTARKDHCLHRSSSRFDICMYYCARRAIYDCKQAGNLV